MAKSTRPWFFFLANWALSRIFRVVLRVQIRGLENVPREGPLVIAISHSSFLDPVLAGVYLPRPVVPMAKIEAFDYPVLGLGIRLYGAFPVKRGAVDLSAFKTALQILRNGDALVIAPEGHRSDSGSLQRGREGAIMLSVRTGSPILPVAVWGGKPFWANLTRLRRTDMWFHVGKPAIPADQNGKPSREHISAMSDELMMRIAEMMPAELRGYYADPSRVTTQYLQNHNGVGAHPSTVSTDKEVAKVTQAD